MHDVMRIRSIKDRGNIGASRVCEKTYVVPASKLHPRAEHEGNPLVVGRP